MRRGPAGLPTHTLNADAPRFAPDLHQRPVRHDPLQPTPAAHAHVERPDRPLLPLPRPAAPAAPDVPEAQDLAREPLKAGPHLVRHTRSPPVVPHDGPHVRRGHRRVHPRAESRAQTEVRGVLHHPLGHRLEAPRCEVRAHRAIQVGPALAQLALPGSVQLLPEVVARQDRRAQLVVHHRQDEQVLHRDLGEVREYQPRQVVVQLHRLVPYPAPPPALPLGLRAHRVRRRLRHLGALPLQAREQRVAHRARLVACRRVGWRGCAAASRGLAVSWHSCRRAASAALLRIQTASRSGSAPAVLKLFFPFKFKSGGT